MEHIHANFTKIQSCVNYKVKGAIKNTNAVEENEMLGGKLNIR